MKYTRDVLAPIVMTSRSLAEVMRRLGLVPNGGNHRYLAARVRQAGLDTSHFLYRRASLDEATSNRAVAQIARNALTDEQVFTSNSRVTKGARLVKRLLARGWVYRCAWCGISEWRSAPLVLHLDHINGVANDNRVENLRLLCPNCHSQTPTYCNRRR